jgi:hypothetical protein
MEWNDGRTKRAALLPEKLPRDGPGNQSDSGEWSIGDESPLLAPKKPQLCNYAKFGVMSGTIQRGQQELTCGIMMSGAISPWQWVVHGTPGLRLVFVVIAEGTNPIVAATIL